MTRTPSPTSAGAKPRHKKPPILTKRDMCVLEVFRHVRFIETSTLSAFLTPEPFPNHQRLRLRLPRLAALGLLDRPARRITADHEQAYELSTDEEPRGRPEDVWALAQHGADLLKLSGDWNKNNGRLRPSAFAHPLMVTRIYATLRVAIAHALIDIESWQGENAFRDHVAVGRDDLPICPDATFEIADRRSDLTAPVFLETDNSTEPLTRSSFDGSSFLKKCIAYWHYWSRVIRPQPDAAMIVLTVAKTRAWAERLRETAGRSDPRRRGLNLFWFASEEDWTIAEPEAFLYQPIWKTAAGEKRALFERGGR